MQQNSGDEQAQGQREEPCKIFVMVNLNQGLDIPPLQARCMTPPTSESYDKGQQFCQLYTMPLIDQDEDDETSEALINAFGPSKDQAIADEI